MNPAMRLTVLFPLLWIAGCPNTDLQGECVPDYEYTDNPQIVPNIAPFVFCPRDPDSINRRVKGSIVLNNCGRKTLEISGYEIVNDDPPDVFKDLQLVPESVNAGETAAVEFVYEAVDLERHSGHIYIESNAENYAKLDIVIGVPANNELEGTVCSPVGGEDGGVGEDVGTGG